ncbi:hypothetical protein J2W98_003674 [Paenibacillus peoriae]|uniref:Uncharacterized protein n=1 Tax=Paenibacillus peoriae TaxID=59893 RepID=A0ABU1QIA8_9BACL|nr:hypothetical protein [Paenibacillus peoriae]MDR6779394.1 hypothetical protein [Paenibacillus peoriae]
MSNIIILTMQMSGVRAFYEFNCFDDFESEYEYLSNNTYLQGAVLKGKLWDESKRWEKLKEKIKRMRW